MTTPRRAVPRLVFAIGNASRGDDALGPLLAQTLRDEGWFDGGPDGPAELIEVYQLQVEDALELQGRRKVLFIDADRRSSAGAAAQGSDEAPVAGCAGVTLRPVHAAPALPVFSHALEPAALLAVGARVCDQPVPPASVLAIAGTTFELGAPLSAAARDRLPAALALARAWLGADLGVDLGSDSDADLGPDLGPLSQGAASAPSTKHSQAVHSVWLG